MCNLTLKREKISEKIMEKIRTTEGFKPIGEKAAAILLGMSYSKLKLLRRSGKIGFLRVERSIKYSLCQLERFLERAEVDAENW